MTKTPLHQVLRTIKPLAPFHKMAHLRGLISSEPKRSIRRRELEAALKDLVNKQLRKENRCVA